MPRSVPRWLPALGLLALLACAPSPDPPHVVVIMADDLGWGDVGFHEGRFPTPAIDGLAAEGVELSQFYVLPVCSPTRAAMLTGRHPLRYGLQQGATHLPLTERTLAQDLREAGYTTAIVGKWHLGWEHPAYRPRQRGFDHQYGFYTGSTFYFERVFFDTREPSWFRNDEPLEEEGYATDLIAAEAVRLIEAQDPERPLFLWVSFNAPHTPLESAPRHRELYPELSPALRRYGQVLAGLDEGVARVLEAIDRRGWRERTLVLFLSDNGPSSEAPSSAGRLRGHKHLLFEGGVRVPALVRWSGVLPEGGVFEPPLHAVDLRPTLLGLAAGPNGEAAGEASPPSRHEFDGVDFWPALYGGEPLPREWLLYNADGDPRRAAAIRKGDMKLILRGGRADLFDLSRDPYETQNLVARHPRVREELEARLDAWRERAIPAMPGGRSLLPEVDAEVRARWSPSVVQ